MVATRRKKGGTGATPEKAETSGEEAAVAAETEELPLGSFGTIAKDAARCLKLRGLADSVLGAGEKFGQELRDLITSKFGIKAEQVDGVRKICVEGTEVALLSFSARVPRNRVFTQKEKLLAPLTVEVVTAEDLEMAASDPLPASAAAAMSAEDEAAFDAELSQSLEEEEDVKDEEPQPPVAPVPVAMKTEPETKPPTTNGNTDPKMEVDTKEDVAKENADEDAVKEEAEEEGDGDGGKEEEKDENKGGEKPKGPFDYDYPPVPFYKQEPLVPELGIYWRMMDEGEEDELAGRQLVLTNAGLSDITANVFLYHALLRARSIDFHADNKAPFMHPVNGHCRLVLTFAKPRDAMQAVIDGLWSINKKTNSPGKVKVYVPKNPETEAMEATLRKKTGSTHKPDNYVPNRQVLIRGVDRNLGELELRSTLELAEKVEAVRVVQDSKGRPCVLVTFVSGKFAVASCLSQGRIRLGIPDRRTKERRWCDMLLMKDMSTPDFLLKAEKVIDRAKEAAKPNRKRGPDEEGTEAGKNVEEGATPASVKKEDEPEEKKMGAEEGATPKAEEPASKKAKTEDIKKTGTPSSGKRGRGGAGGNRGNSGGRNSIGSISRNMHMGRSPRGTPLGGGGRNMGGGIRPRGGPGPRGAPMGPVWSSGAAPGGPPIRGPVPQPMGAPMAMGGAPMGMSGGGGRAEQLTSMVMEQQRQLEFMNTQIQQRQQQRPQPIVGGYGGGGGRGGMGMGGNMGGGMGVSGGNVNVGTGAAYGGGPPSNQRSVFDQGGGRGVGGGRAEVWASSPGGRTMGSGVGPGGGMGQGGGGGPGGNQPRYGRGYY